MFDVRVFGLALRLLSRGNYCETTALFSPQFYDVEELRWVSESLKADDVFVDVGGNVGLYSLITAKRCPKVAVFAVEPDPILAKRMQFNARNNGLKISALAYALSDYEGRGALERSNYQSGGNRLAANETNASSDNQFEVDVTTLFNLCEINEITSINTLKIDIEGHEKKVLSHFFSHAPKTMWPQCIVIERVHDADGIVESLINQHGYTLKNQSARNVLLTRDMK